MKNAFKKIIKNDSNGLGLLVLVLEK